MSTTTNEDRQEALEVIETLRDDTLDLETHVQLCNWLHCWVSEVDTIEEVSTEYGMEYV